MENNHAFITYEADLRAHKSEIAKLKTRVEDAEFKTESTKTSLANRTKYAQKLKDMLDGKQDEIRELQEELEIANQSRKKIEDDIKNRLFEKVQEKFERAKSLLTDLRMGPSVRVNLLGQNMNNLDLVNLCLSDTPPDLHEEKADLEKEVAKYSNAAAEYDTAFKAIMDLLSFTDGESTGAPERGEDRLEGASESSQKNEELLVEKMVEEEKDEEEKIEEEEGDGVEPQGVPATQDLIAKDSEEPEAPASSLLDARGDEVKSPGNINEDAPSPGTEA